MRGRKSCLRGKSNDRAVRHGRGLGNYHDPVTDDVAVTVFMGEVAGVGNANLAADAAILVENGALNHRAIADGEAGDAAADVFFSFRVRLEIVRADDDAVANRDVVADAAAHADHGPLDAPAGVNDAAVR